MCKSDLIRKSTLLFLKLYVQMCQIVKILSANLSWSENSTTNLLYHKSYTKENSYVYLKKSNLLIIFKIGKGFKLFRADIYVDFAKRSRARKNLFKSVLTQINRKKNCIG